MADVFCKIDYLAVRCSDCKESTNGGRHTGEDHCVNVKLCKQRFTGGNHTRRKQSEQSLSFK